MQQQFNIIQVDPQQFELQVYSEKDTSLISTFEIGESFNSQEDYIELHVYDANSSYLIGLEDYTNYKIYDTNLVIDPAADLEDLGFYTGQYFSVYNFFKSLLGSSENTPFFISEISADRTEVRLSTNTIDAQTIERGVTSVLTNLNNSTYYYDFYLNFGFNNLVIANNIQLDSSNPTNPTVLIKLYEPLPDSFQLNDITWVVENQTAPVAYNITANLVLNEVQTTVNLRGPNFTIADVKQAAATNQASYTEILTTNSAQGSASFQYKLNSLLQEKGIEINIDYSDYANFVHFSSAQTRLENFYYKLSLIEQYQASASIVSSGTTYTSASNALWQRKIDDIITHFDGYEYYLYYESGSTTWPKRTIEPPYQNYPTTDLIAVQWLEDQLAVASSFDDLNKDYLVYAIPQYIREDSNNEQFNLFVEMIGQHFDIVWTYTKDVTQKFNADNRLDFGISKDLIADTLRDLGVSLYENNFATQNIYSSLLGVTPESSLLNIPNISLTTPVPTGLEYVTDYVLASPTSSLLPLDDANKEIYKRIYHNLPLLLKKKGTTAGLKLLLNLYGIPDTILRINEFGGQDKVNTDDWDNWQDTFNYALLSKAYEVESVSGIAPWQNLTTTNKTPQTIEFRFKTTEFPPTYYTSSLAVFVSSSNGEYLSEGFVLEYTGSGLTSGSYSGSTYDPYYQYATLKYVSSSVSASTYLPFYNGDWWSIGLTLQSASNGYTASLYAKQKGTFVGDSYIKYEGSSSIILKNVPSASSYLYIPDNPTISIPFTYGGGKQARPIYSASFQELRYYSVPISESVFDDFVMNPYSIEGNSLQGVGSAYNTLLYRINLGSDLNKYYPTISSSHPSVTGSTPTQSFSGNIAGTYLVQYSGLDSSPIIYNENKEYVYQKQPNAGIQIAVSDKIKIGQPNMPIGNVLSAYSSVQQRPAASQSYTNDVNYVEVAFSPQDEINDDIIDQLGYFNIGEYIGDPRFESSSATSYPDLNTLRNEYFIKYIRNYDLTDYLRLIKFFDNSLFKMIKDFVPARTGLATGAVIKQHLLERNRYAPPQASWEEITYSGSVTSLSSGYATGSKIYTFTGSTGGTVPYLQNYTSSGYYPPYINISQSWQEIVITPSGSNTITHNTLDEFYNGEFEGTSITVTNGSLTDEDCQIFLDVNVAETNYIPVVYNYTYTSESVFLTEVLPLSGEISIYYTRDFLAEGVPNRPSTITD